MNATTPGGASPWDTPDRFRAAVRQGLHRKPTAGICPGFVQVNLVVLPAEHALHFLLFSQRNPKPLPILEALEPGQHESRFLAPGADIRTDFPGYRIARRGRTESVDSLMDVWRPDLASFLVGCSFSFETALAAAGIPLRHLEQGVNVPMYRTDKELAPSGPFAGRLVVTMRPIPAGRVPDAVTITARCPGVHGAPLHVGCPETLGIADLSRPDFGDPVEVRPGEVPVFWACGVSGLSAVLAANLEFAATHEPGHMLVTDRRDAEYFT